jgi:hypothetical protein
MRHTGPVNPRQGTKLSAMSEYQYYEFRKIGSSLSDEAMEEISDLSSRAEVSRTSASFTYNYGDFRGDPIKVLSQHFDALFYTANWGSRRLAFCFPISAVNYEVICEFAFGETINIQRKDVHLIIDLFFQDDSLNDWVDGEGTLGRVIGLYDDLLAEDYRPLFLAWLQAALLDYGWEPDVALPPVPPGLRELSERHRALIDLFDIDSDLVAAAASFSDPIRRVSNEDLAREMESMPSAQQAGFLRRMLLGEPPSVVISELRGALRSGARIAKASNIAALTSPVSAAALFAKAQQMESDREHETREREAALKLRRLEAIERDEKGLWQRVDNLLPEKTVKAYDDAVGILKDLRTLALHKQQWEEFVRRVEAIRAKYSRLSGLQRRIENAKLLERSEPK